MPVIMLCERALGLLNATDLRDLDSGQQSQLESLNYSGLAGAFAQKEALACALHFANAQDYLLQLHPWVFARKESAPAQLTSSMGGWRYAYALPTDCLKVLALIRVPSRAGEDGIYHRATGAEELRHWEQAGRAVACNSKGIRARYTARISNSDLWDPCFTEAFCAILAMRIAPMVCGNAAIAGPMAQAMSVVADSAIAQAYRTGLIAEAHELPAQSALWLDYSGAPTGFDDQGNDL